MDTSGDAHHHTLTHMHQDLLFSAAFPFLATFLGAGSKIKGKGALVVGRKEGRSMKVSRGEVVLPRKVVAQGGALESDRWVCSDPTPKHWADLNRLHHCSINASISLSIKGDTSK